MVTLCLTLPRVVGKVGSIVWLFKIFSPSYQHFCFRNELFPYVHLSAFHRFIDIYLYGWLDVVHVLPDVPWLLLIKTVFNLTSTACYKTVASRF